MKLSDPQPAAVVPFDETLSFERLPDGVELVEVPLPRDIRRALDGAHWRHQLDLDVWATFAAYDWFDLDNDRHAAEELMERARQHRKLIDFDDDDRRDIEPLTLRFPSGAARRWEDLAKHAQTTPLRLIQGAVLDRYHNSTLASSPKHRDGLPDSGKPFIIDL
ncbi:hypothetical protein [Haloferula sp. A504]|uniref:hypothetical protein n=1 Tax=Haloferula sp. A504 TaxID=3373601 RepID=UPI0031C09FCE|nr:hypothetical protein [Verrucomicrobiaceae bacterium E54]